MVSVDLKGTGVRPEVGIEPADGLITFGNILVNETSERSFKITNVSSFPVNFKLVSEASGVDNLSKKRPFLLVPSEGTIQAKATYEVKITF
jgi:P pilus assembly chaperone PapD